MNANDAERILVRLTELHTWGEDNHERTNRYERLKDEYWEQAKAFVRERDVRNQRGEPVLFVPFHCPCVACATAERHASNKK